MTGTSPLAVGCTYCGANSGVSCEAGPGMRPMSDLPGHSLFDCNHGCKRHGGRSDPAIWDEPGRSASRSVEQDSRGEWHWFCLRDGCNWSGMGLLSEDGANREVDRHDKEFHP